MLPVLKTLLDILSERETQKILIRLAIGRQIIINELREDFGIEFETILLAIDYLLDQGIIIRNEDNKFVVAKTQKAECLVKVYRDMIREDIAKQLFEVEKFLNSKRIEKATFETFLDDFDNLLKIYKPLIDNEFSEQLQRILSKIKKLSKKYSK